MMGVSLKWNREKIFEPVNISLSKTKNRALDPVRSTWLHMLNRVRTYIKHGEGIKDVIPVHL